MNIIIAGDGKVGATLTRLLSAEGHDITSGTSGISRNDREEYHHDHKHDQHRQNRAGEEPRTPL